MDDLFGIDSDEDSDIGPATFSNDTPASSQKVGAVRVGATWNAAVLGNAYGVQQSYSVLPLGKSRAIHAPVATVMILKHNYPWYR